jgi:hypothetical protein
LLRLPEGVSMITWTKAIFLSTSFSFVGSASDFILVSLCRRITSATPAVPGGGGRHSKLGGYAFGDPLQFRLPFGTSQAKATH